MKRFDTLKWIRQVRDSYHERHRNLSAEEKLRQTKAEAEEFRKSRPHKDVSSPRKG